MDVVKYFTFRDDFWTSTNRLDNESLSAAARTRKFSVSNSSAPKKFFSKFFVLGLTDTFQEYVK